MTAALRNYLLFGAVLVASTLLGACNKSAAPTPHRSSPAAHRITAATVAPVTTHTVATKAPVTIKPAPASTVASPQPADPGAPLRVAKLSLGSSVDKNLEVIAPSTHFSDDSKIIYASVDTLGSSRSATLNAKWSYLESNGQLISSVSQSIATDGPAVTTFKLENPDYWPDGKYKIDITLDGKPAASQDFQISKR